MSILIIGSVILLVKNTVIETGCDEPVGSLLNGWLWWGIGVGLQRGCDLSVIPFVAPTADKEQNHANDNGMICQIGYVGDHAGNLVVDKVDYVTVG